MKRLLLSLGFLTILGTAQAEYLESNVTIQIKLYSLLETPPSGGVTIYNHSITSFKTLDFINQVAFAKGQPAYTSKARLIYRILRSDTESEASFLIREKGRNDYVLEQSMIQIIPAPHIRAGAEARVEKGKKNSEGVGTVKYTLLTDTTLKPDGTDLFLKITGQAVQSVRSIISKQYPEHILNCSTIQMTGAGSFDINPSSPNVRNSYALGSLKMSAPKITPNE